jgi:hypothetical protein
MAFSFPLSTTEPASIIYYHGHVRFLIFSPMSALSFFRLPQEHFYSSFPNSFLSTDMGAPVPGASSGGFEAEPNNGC